MTIDAWLAWQRFEKHARADLLERLAREKHLEGRYPALEIEPPLASEADDSP